MSAGVVYELKPCGTVAAYQRHRRRGEPACVPCLEAYAAYTRERRSRATRHAPRRLAPVTASPLMLPAAPEVLPCATDPDAWFPEGDDYPAIEAAKAACRTCPALARCLTWVTASPQEFGVWAALSERERRKLKRQLAA